MPAGILAVTGALFVMVLLAVAVQKPLMIPLVTVTETVAVEPGATVTVTEVELVVGAVAKEPPVTVQAYS